MIGGRNVTFQMKTAVVVAGVVLTLLFVPGCAPYRAAPTPGGEKSVSAGERADSLGHTGDREDPGEETGGLNHYLNRAPAREIKVDMVRTPETELILSEERLYPVAKKYQVIKTEDGGNITWTVKGFGPHSFILHRDGAGRVFITKKSGENQPEVEKIEITGELRKRGLASDFILTHVKMGGTDLESKNFINFKVKDGSNWALFSSQWQGPKDLRTVPLHRFDVVDTDSTLVNYTGDKYYLLDVYLKQEGEKKYILTWDEQDQTLTSYALPAEIGEVREMFYTPKYGEQAVYLAATDTATAGGELFAFRLDLTSGLLTRGQALKEWEELFPPQWRFTGDLPYNYLVGGTKDTLLVFGDDGGLSGFHDSAYLYGVDRQTGQKKWSVYGGFLPVYFYVGEKEDTVTVAVKTKATQPHRLVHMEMDTGRVIWEKQMDEWDQYYEFSLAGSGNTVLLYLRESGTQPAAKLIAMDENDGQVLWEKDLTAGQRLLSAYHTLPLAIIVGKDKIEAFNSRTGKPAWRLDAPINPDNFGSNFDRVRVMADPRYWSGKPPGNTYWFAMEDRFRLVDLNSGKILSSLHNNGNRIVNVLNDDYLIIRDFSGPYFFQGEVTSKLYSLKKQEVLWTKQENIRTALVEGERLYYSTGERVASVDLASGKQLWTTPFGTKYSKQLLMVGSELVVPGEKGIFIFDRKSGRFLYQVADFYLGDPEARYLLNYYGMLTGLQDGLYLGSSSGFLELLQPNIPF